MSDVIVQKRMAPEATGTFAPFSLAIGGGSASAAIPGTATITASGGAGGGVYVRVTASAACRIVFGLSDVVALPGHLLVTAGSTEDFFVRFGLTHVAVTQESGSTGTLSVQRNSP